MLRRHFLALAAAFTTMIPAAAIAQPISVVASFSILGDMVREVAGPHATVTTLVGPNGDGHVYQPSPKDARQVSSAQLVVVNGLGFEGWMERLTDAAGYRGPVVVATKGVPTIGMGEDHDEHGHDEHGHDEHGHEKHDAHDHKAHDDGADPHAWQDLANARHYVANIAEGLAQVDPANKAEYQARAKDYVARIDALDRDIRQAFGEIPHHARKVITPHDAFGYFAKAYGITFIAPQGVTTESEASAGQVAALVRQIRAEGAKAIFVENISDRRLIDQIIRETGAKIGGALFSDALSEESGPAPTYLDMMRHNGRILAGALTQG